MISTRERARASGFSLIEMMIVSTVFVLVAISIYGSLNSITQMQSATDSSVTLQIEGQKALNSIVDELRNAGFYRPAADMTVGPYDSNLWVTPPADDAHTSWDVPYLYASEGNPAGHFAGLGHTPAKHDAGPTDEEYGVTRELCFIPLKPVLTGAAMGPPSATVQWSSSMLGAASSIVLSPNWQAISYELHTDPDGINRLKRITRPVDVATNTIGAPTDTRNLARFIEAVRFDTAQTDASLSLNTVRITIWLRKATSQGHLVKAKVSSRVKLRNSAKT